MGTTADTAEVMLGFFRQLITLINYAMHRHLINDLIRQVNSRKSATAGTLHLRRALMTNRGGLLLPQPREG